VAISAVIISCWSRLRASLGLAMLTGTASAECFSAQGHEYDSDHEPECVRRASWASWSKNIRAISAAHAEPQFAQVRADLHRMQSGRSKAIIAGVVCEGR
jgi:hypothetical protein